MSKITNADFLEGFQYSFHYQCQVTIFSICYFKLCLLKINRLYYLGANNMVSQRTPITFYESVIDGVKSYYNTVMNGIEINSCAVAPPKKLS